MLLGIIGDDLNDYVEHFDEPNVPELLDLNCVSWELSCELSFFYHLDE